MFCTRCGAALSGEGKFCPMCGFQEKTGGRGVFRFHGNGGELLGIYAVYVLLSIVTFGIYSFWGRTNVRRYMWNATELNGERFVWHGTGEELIKGWLKALLIMLLLYGQMGVFVLTLGESLGSLIGGVILFLGFSFLLPLMLVGSWRYRLSRTSYRGIRFSFDGNAEELWPRVMKDLLLLVVTLGFYLPWFLTNLRKYFVEHVRYGTLRFQYGGRGADLLPPFLITIALAVPTLTLIRFYFEAVTFRRYWGETRAGEARFETTLSAVSLMMISIGYALLTAVTLGIAYPWMAVRLARLYAESLTIENMPDLTHILAEAGEGDSTGQELAHLLDLDGVDLGIGI